MIRLHDVNDVTDVLDRSLGGAAKGPLSLLRIVIWAAIGFLLIGVVWQAPGVALSKTTYNKKITDPHVRDVTLDKNDPRGFAHRDHGPNSFTIAWVGASTLQSIAPKRYTFLPADVKKLIPEAEGKTVYVDMYFMSGARTIDIYNATEAAIAAKPDLIVVSLNPVWLFNDAAIQSWDNLDSISFRNSLSNPSSWALLAALQSPSDVALSAADRAFPALRNRWSYAQKLNEKVDQLSPLDTSDPPKAEGKPSELAQVAAMSSPLEFWSKYRPATAAGSSLADRQLAFLAGGDPGKKTVNDIVVNAMFASLAASGIPSYVYVDAIDPEARKDPRVEAQLVRIEDHVKSIADKHQSPNVKVHWQSVGRDVGAMPFDDLVHMKDDRKLAAYLATELCDHLVATDTLSTCSPLDIKLP